MRLLISRGPGIEQITGKGNMSSLIQLLLLKFELDSEVPALSLLSEALKSPAGGPDLKELGVLLPTERFELFKFAFHLIYLPLVILDIVHKQVLLGESTLEFSLGHLCQQRFQDSVAGKYDLSETCYLLRKVQ